MRTLILKAAAIAVLLVGASRADAQEQTPTLGGADRARVTFNEVERGVYAGGQFGLLFAQVPGLGKGLASGMVVGANLGWDFSSYFGVGLFGMAISLSTPSGYQGLGAASGPGGDFTGILPGVEARLHLPIAQDSNNVNRLFLNVGLGGGLMFLTPAALFANSGDAPAGKVDVSLEYFSRLRHLSFGLAVEALAVLPNGGQILGGDLSPFLRYSF